MNKRILVYTALMYGFVGLIACSAANNTPLDIEFSADSSTILLKHVDAAGLHQLSNTAALDSNASLFLRVLDTPDDDDSTAVETEIEGTVRIINDQVEFRPVTPFVRGKQYLVSTYLNTKFGNFRSVLTGSISKGVKPNQKLLRR